jgi:16S rRNA (adenine1518-N6/adenine1519-N6)-dimethyltransferase
MRLKKTLGQHLLVNKSALEKIVRSLNPSKQDIVMEIGPGTGNLTKILAEHAGTVIAIEKDMEMVERLNILSQDFKNLKIIHADFLKLDLPSLFYDLRFAIYNSRLFCGNLPYNISTPILFKLRDNKEMFSRGVIMVQREVAKRLVAKPGNKDYGVLSIMLQTDAGIKKIFDLSPGSFLPPPKVTSTVLSVEFPSPPPYQVKKRDQFEQIVKGAFNQRRKMIRNTLPPELLSLLKTVNIKPTDRPENLSIADFIKLSELF